MAKAQEVGTFPIKYTKRLSQEFIDATEQLNSDEIKERILTCEGHLNQIDAAKVADTKLAEAREMVKEMSAPYRDGLKEETAKLKFCIFVLEGRGIEL